MRALFVCLVEALFVVRASAAPPPPPKVLKYIRLRLLAHTRFAVPAAAAAAAKQASCTSEGLGGGSPGT